MIIQPVQSRMLLSGSFNSAAATPVATNPRRQQRHHRCNLVQPACTSSNQGEPAPQANDSDGFGSQLRKGRQSNQGQSKPATSSRPSNSAASNDGLGALGRMGNTVVLGNDMSEETWREMDKKLNKYPGYRTFTAIGSGGDAFKTSMIQAVEQVVGAVHPECVSQRPSSKGAYLSVRLLIEVQSPEQVIQIFANMKKDDRLKWYM